MCPLFHTFEPNQTKRLHNVFVLLFKYCIVKKSKRLQKLTLPIPRVGGGCPKLDYLKGTSPFKGYLFL